MSTSLEKPPNSGRLILEYSIRPVSLQGSSKAKQELTAFIQEYIKNYKFLFSGEIKIEVSWLLHPKERYEGIQSPDIDNILKPIIDALCGINGILINDCQVQSVCCSWIDQTKDDHNLTIELNFSPDDWIKKEYLLWIEVSQKLCMPIHTDLPIEAQLKILETWKKMFATKLEAISKTGLWENGQIFMPIQMPFHRARLNEFNLSNIEDYKKFLTEQT